MCLSRAQIAESVLVTAAGILASAHPKFDIGLTSQIRSNDDYFRQRTSKVFRQSFNLTETYENPTVTMENEKGDIVDLYVPRKCSATNRIIKAKDHASVQISVGKVDESGRYTGENQVYALCGFVRSRAESDDCMNRLAQKDGFLKGVWSASAAR